METWKPMIGYNGVYEVSDTGRIKRVKAAKGTQPGRILRQKRNKKGYCVVRPFSNGIGRSILVHVLVLETFVCPRPPGLQTNHKNGNKADNRLENLEWVSPSENLKHSFRVLKSKNHRGVNNPASKLSGNDVIKIRELWDTGKYNLPQLARMYGVYKTTIHKIIHHLTWKHLS